MSIFPAISPPSVSAGNTPLPLCREVAWDFQRDIPVFCQGEPVTVEGKEAVKVWIWRVLRTPRYRYEIYSRTYGSEFESLIGQACTDALKEAEAPRYLRECLLVNPYISGVKNISVRFSDGLLTVAGTADTVYGEVEFRADL